MRGGGNLRDGRVYLLAGGEAQAQVRGGRACLVAEDGGEALEAAADVGDGLAVAGQGVRFLPRVQDVAVALLEACQALLGIAGGRLLGRRAPEESAQLRVGQSVSRAGMRGRRRGSLTKSMAGLTSPWSLRGVRGRWWRSTPTRLRKKSRLETAGVPDQDVSNGGSTTVCARPAAISPSVHGLQAWRFCFFAISVIVEA